RCQHGGGAPLRPQSRTHRTRQTKPKGAPKARWVGRQLPRLNPQANRALTRIRHPVRPRPISVECIREQYSDPAFQRQRLEHARDLRAAQHASRIAKSCLDSLADFDEVETGFLKGMARGRAAPSEKQEAWLMRLAERSDCTEGGL